MGHVVEDLNVVEATIVDLVLDGFNKVMVAHRVLARGWLGPGYKHNARFPVDIVRIVRVPVEPCPALLIPIADFHAQCVWLPRFGLILIA